jgi:hypothetical protein
LPISEKTRRNVIQIFKSNNIKWSGKLNDVEFLSRLYDLETLPSTDSRYKDAKWDISTHRVSFPEDWLSDWIFGDKRFDLHHCPDDEFLRFICETIDPNVRPDRQETNDLLEEFNRALAEDSVRIEATKTKFGVSKYEGKGITPTTISGVNQLEESISALSWEYVERQINRMRTSIEKDPELSIGTAKELVESICKTILAQGGNPPKGKDDLPKLIQNTLRQLGILDTHRKDDAKTQDTVRKLLASLSTLVQSAAELRNLHGTGHGKDARTALSSSKYATLAVNSAATIAMFLLQAYGIK